MDTIRIGFDIGTDCVSSVVLSKTNNLLFCPEPVFHFGNPVHALKDSYEKIIGEYGRDAILSTVLTGNGGEFFARELNVPFFHDTITIPAGVRHIAPEARYIFHVGARDSYFFEMEDIEGSGSSLTFVPDHGTGTKCGGGSGILITKQCRRYFESSVPVNALPNDEAKRRALLNDRLNHIFELADRAISQSTRSIDVGGRCGVVIQSDMIHLQNNGERIPDILSGLYQRIIKNYKSDVLKTRSFDREVQAVASGGVFQSSHLLRILEKTLGVSVTFPGNIRSAGALGAVLKAGGDYRAFMPEQLQSIAETEKKSIRTMPGIGKALEHVIIYPEDRPDDPDNPLMVFETDESGPFDVILGVDGGSTTTKVVVARTETLKILAQICLYTNGKPMETIQDIFRRIHDRFGHRLNIVAVAYTGSSGAFYHKLFTRSANGTKARTIDLVKDEITCHALGVRHFNENTDTIFELGGQDAKFTLFNPDGTVKKSRMNLSCMAGTGQTMQNMVEMLGLDIRTSFHDYALAAESTPVVDDTCGVFTEAGIARLISLGFPKEEIAAAIAYGFMGGYVNKFIGNETFGQVASAQGGPFLGKAPLAALAMHTGMTIHAFPHRQMFGALGAAIAAHKTMEQLRRDNIDFACQFRGLSLFRLTFEKTETLCSALIDQSCSIKDCRLSVYSAGAERIVTGGACPKGNTDRTLKKAPDYVLLYKTILDKHLSVVSRDAGPATAGGEERVLIPRSLSFLNEKGVFYATLYQALGFDVQVSSPSNDEICELGLCYSHSETCFPVKLAHGHAAYLKNLMRPGKDKMLLVNTIGADKKRYKFCPYVSSAGFLAKDALDLDNSDVLLPVVFFRNPYHPIHRAFYKDLKRVFGGRFGWKQVRDAVKKAIAAERAFLKEIYETGGEIVSKLRGKKEKIFIGLGRGYTLLDDKASSRVHELFVNHGLHFIPSFFLKPVMHDISYIAENMYWVQGRNIIRYNLETALHPDFFPVRTTNFNCGSDSMLLYHEEDIIEKSGKPHLVLQTDGHSSNAQFGTRTLANYEVVKSFTPKPVSLDIFVTKHPDVVLKNKIVGIPYISDQSYILSATFRALGFDSEVIPTQTPEAKHFADKLGGGSGNICQPFAFQVGDTLSWLHSLEKRGIDPEQNAVVFQPMAKGPCRFGQYHVLLKRIFSQNGFGGVDILSPDADRDYINLPLTDKQIVSQAKNLFNVGVCLETNFDALLRTRPYEKEKGSVQAFYDEQLSLLITMAENKADLKTLKGFMEKAQPAYERLIDPSIPRKPIIAMTGEIFVRLNHHANNQSVLMLEKYGLETRLTPISQWIEYTNSSSIKTFWITNHFKRFVKALIKQRFMQKNGAILTEPFREFLKGRETHDSYHIIDHIQKALVYDKRIMGESPLSIGEAYMFANGKLPGIAGIYHVGPFGCMQETTATSQIQSLNRQKRNSAANTHEKIIPFMDAVFGDSSLANLEAEIAVFSEKCHLKQRLSQGGN